MSFPNGRGPAAGRTGRSRQTKGIRRSGNVPVSRRHDAIENLDISKMDVAALVGHGKKLHRIRKYREAVEVYTRLIAICPNEVQYLSARAASRMAMNLFPASLLDLHLAHSLESQSPSMATLNRISKCYRHLGEADKALSFAQRAVRIGETLPSDPANDVQRATAAEAVDKASSMLTDLAEIQSAKAEAKWDKAHRTLEGIWAEHQYACGANWWRWKAQVCLGMGDLDAALSFAKDLLGLVGSADATYLCGMILLFRDQLSEGESHLDIALQLDPGHAPARQLLQRLSNIRKQRIAGLKAAEDKDAESALSLFEEALVSVGTHIEEGRGGWLRRVLICEKAMALRQLGRLDEALRLLPRPSVVQPWTYIVFRSRARVHLAKNDYINARKDYTTAKEQARDMPEVIGALEDEAREAVRLQKAEKEKSRPKTHYEILGVPRDASDEDIKAAFRTLALQTHPDKVDVVVESHEAGAVFDVVKKAFDVLKDPGGRAVYDLSLRLA